MDDAQFHNWQSSITERSESYLERILPDALNLPHQLHGAMRYATLGGGKRIRTQLAHAAGMLSSADPVRLDCFAAALELIHAYSLVHDDLPAMDNDQLRRGKPTVHIAFNEAVAILTGDALQTLAFAHLSETGVFNNSRQQVSLLHLLALASGSAGMAGGQAIDLSAVGKALTLDELKQMHAMKTGALIRAAIVGGALCGEYLNEDLLQSASHFGDQLGLLFQITDDILDAEVASEVLGKTAGKDAQDNKPTFVSLLGIEGAKAEAANCLAVARTIMRPYTGADHLLALADFVAQRSY